MTSRRLLILIVVAVVAIAAGVWLAGRQGSSGSATGAGALYPDLKGQLNAVSAVHIFKAGDARVVELNGERARRLSRGRRQGAPAARRDR
jgi:hypothetical protein